MSLSKTSLIVIGTVLGMVCARYMSKDDATRTSAVQPVKAEVNTPARVSPAGDKATPVAPTCERFAIVARSCNGFVAGWGGNRAVEASEKDRVQTLLAACRGDEGFKVATAAGTVGGRAVTVLTQRGIRSAADVSTVCMEQTSAALRSAGLSP
jgi:hypothetical protein